MGTCQTELDAILKIIKSVPGGAIKKKAANARANKIEKLLKELSIYNTEVINYNDLIAAYGILPTKDGIIIKAFTGNKDSDHPFTGLALVNSEPFTYEKVTYQNLELAFQARKAKAYENKKAQGVIAKLNTLKKWPDVTDYGIDAFSKGSNIRPPGVVANLYGATMESRTSTNQKTWDKHKATVLKNYLTKYYKSNEKARALLASTGTREIVANDTVIEPGLREVYTEVLNEIRGKLTDADYAESTKIGVVQEVASRKGPANKFTNHTGGAYGADSIWANMLRPYSVINNHYIPKSKWGLSKRNKDLQSKHDQVITITDEEATSGETLNNQLGNNTHSMNNRNYVQVLNADTVFAVAPIDDGMVGGGTGSAVRMAQELGKEVYVLDTNTVSWYKYERGRYSSINYLPEFAANFAAIGTRAIEVYKQKDKTTGKFINTIKLKNTDKILTLMQKTVDSSFDKKSKPKQEVNKQDIDEKVGVENGVEVLAPHKVFDIISFDKHGSIEKFSFVYKDKRGKKHVMNASVMPDLSTVISNPDGVLTDTFDSSEAHSQASEYVKGITETINAFANTQRSIKDTIEYLHRDGFAAIIEAQAESVPTKPSDSMQVAIVELKQSLTPSIEETNEQFQEAVNEVDIDIMEELTKCKGPK